MISMLSCHLQKSKCWPSNFLHHTKVTFETKTLLCFGCHHHTMQYNSTTASKTGTACLMKSKNSSIKTKVKAITVLALQTALQPISFPFCLFVPSIKLLPFCNCSQLLSLEEGLTLLWGQQLFLVVCKCLWSLKGHWWETSMLDKL